jgi:hypothetical protein
MADFTEVLEQSFLIHRRSLCQGLLTSVGRQDILTQPKTQEEEQPSDHRTRLGHLRTLRPADHVGPGLFDERRQAPLATVSFQHNRRGGADGWTGCSMTRTGWRSSSISTS